ncbi:MAG: 30S ribosomal protein S6 [Planctomycetota bacterium]
MKRYEGMFLFDSSVARDWAAIEQEVHRLCNRINAELLVCVKFDERRLAFEINRRRRGTYVLTYFDAESEQIGALERDARLSELILRLLVLRAESLTDERLTELKTWPAETPLQPLSGDGRRHDDDRPRGPRFGRTAPADKTSDDTEPPDEPDLDTESEPTERRAAPYV